MEKLKIIETDDGSHTILLPSLNETYHSIHGAIQESEHIYIRAGLEYYLADQISGSLRILEFGFGSGLNCLLTAAKDIPVGRVQYHSLDKYPLNQMIINKLNYGELVNEQALFNKIHEAKWEYEVGINKNFLLKKINCDFREFSPDYEFDIIYFDAFAPDKQPELWTKSIFSRCFQMLNKRGVLVTYSAKGQLKRDLKAVGFIVETLPGPPGKFEITRAIKY